MATKFHIKDDGTPGVCHASTLDTCPKAKAGDIFHGTLAEASVESERRFEASHGAVPSSSSASSSSPVEDRRAFSTDMMDSSEYRVEGGSLKAELEGEDYDLGELKEVSPEEVKSWSLETFGSELELQDGEVFPLYDEEGSEAGAYMRSGDGFYRAGERGAYETDSPHPSSELSPAESAQDLKSEAAQRFDELSEKSSDTKFVRQSKSFFETMERGDSVQINHAAASFARAAAASSDQKLATAALNRFDELNAGRRASTPAAKRG